MLRKFTLRAVAAVGALILPLSMAHAGIVWTGVYVQQNYFQDANGVVPWRNGGESALPGWDVAVGGNAKIDFTLATTAPAEGVGATMTLPGSSTPLPLTPNSNWHTPWYHVDYFGEGYASLAQVLAAYPGGTYNFNAPAAGNTLQTQNAPLNLYANALMNSSMASAIPMLTNYGSLQNMNAGSKFTFTFNAFNGFGATSAGNPQSYTQIGIVDLAKIGQGFAQAGVYVSPQLSKTSTSFDLGANTLQSGTNYAFVVNFDTNVCTPGQYCNGHEMGSYTFGTFSTAAGPAVPQTLVNFQGGTLDNPVPLPRKIDQVGAVGGTIGGAPDVDFYTFAWNGGQFAATATLTGADPNTDFFTFKLIDFVTGNILDQMRLDDDNNFNGTLSDWLPAGVYEIGLVSNSADDPAFTISFDSSGQAAAPEPGTLALLALAGVALMRSRSGWRSSAPQGAGFAARA